MNRLTIDLPAGTGSVRYLRIPGKALNVGEAQAFQKGVALNPAGWRASNIFADYAAAPAKRAWCATFRIDEAARGSYLTIPCNGKHGEDGAYAALRIAGKSIGAPTRAKGYPTNAWETGIGRPDSNLSYFFPVTADMIGKTIEAVVMQFDSEAGTKVPLGEFTAEVWLSAYPIPYESKQLILAE